MMKLKHNVAVSESGFVFHAGTGDSFSVNPVGMKILELIKQGTDQPAIVATITEAYDISQKQLEEDLYDFFSQLKNLKMLDYE